MIPRPKCSSKWPRTQKRSHEEDELCRPVRTCTQDENNSVNTALSSTCSSSRPEKRHHEEDQLWGVVRREKSLGCESPTQKRPRCSTSRSDRRCSTCWSPPQGRQSKHRPHSKESRSSQERNLQSTNSTVSPGMITSSTELPQWRLFFFRESSPGSRQLVSPEDASTEPLASSRESLPGTFQPIISPERASLDSEPLPSSRESSTGALSGQAASVEPIRRRKRLSIKQPPTPTRDHASARPPSSSREISPGSLSSLQRVSLECTSAGPPPSSRQSSPGVLFEEAASAHGPIEPIRRRLSIKSLHPEHAFHLPEKRESKLGDGIATSTKAEDVLQDVKADTPFQHEAITAMEVSGQSQSARESSLDASREQLTIAHGTSKPIRRRLSLKSLHPEHSFPVASAESLPLSGDASAQRPCTPIRRRLSLKALHPEHSFDVL